MKKILVFILVAGVILGIFYFFNKQEVVAPTVVAPVVTEDTTPKELCFAKFGTPTKDGYYDKYTLRLILNGEKATGELNFVPAEKDSKTGEINGTVGAVNKTTMSRTADLWWYTFAEGMQAKEELKIIFGEGTASIGTGEMLDRGDGVYVYKDSKNISYNLELTDVACGDLVERASVEGYLKDNITELSPKKAVLGGTWYVISTTIDLNKNTGVVNYEDGHIQEKSNFSYTTNDKQEVVSLKIE
ncbi:MAG: hypothetical protein WCT44_01955 [Candidatus Paceibacterota bacterium]